MKSKLLVLSALLTLTGCSSEDLETANLGSSINKNKYNLVNASDYEVAFHMANVKLNGSERDVEQSQYHVATLSNQVNPKTVSHEHNVSRDVSFFVKSTSKVGLEKQVEYKVKQDTDYHFVAAQTPGGSLTISLIKKQQNDHLNTFTVRVFTTQTITLRNGQSTNSVSAGSLSDWLQVNNCTDTLIEGVDTTELCNASLDKSYLLITDGKALKKVVLE